MFVLGLICGVILSIIVVFIWALARARSIVDREEEKWVKNIYEQGGWSDGRGMGKR